MTGWASARNVLAIRLDNAGDVIMTGPAIRAIKDGLAGRTVTLLASSAGAAAGRLLPGVDACVAYDAPWMKSGRCPATGEADAAMAAELRQKGFDACVIFTVYSQSPLPAAFLARLADIPLRLAHCRENPYSLLTDWIAEPEPQIVVRHEVRRQLDLAAAIGCRTDDERLRLNVSKKALKRARAALASAGVDPGRPWVLIHPGASAPSRRYSPDGFAQAARAIERELGLRIVFSGSPAEAPLIQSIASGLERPASLAGRLEFEELCAAVSLAGVLVSNNTGPAHIAAATGTPVVDLYALTNPQHTPWCVPARVLFTDVGCRWCYKSVCPEGHHRCLAAVPPSAIVRAVAELLGARRDAIR